MKRAVVLSFVALLMLESAAWAGLGREDTLYVGGTLDTIKANTLGVSSVAGTAAFVFQHPGGLLIIPYDRMDSLEYGQKAGRRLAMLPLAPVFLFSKKRKHYLTIGFKDKSGKEQAIVLELGKDVVRQTLSAISARSGHKIEYQKDEEPQTATGERPETKN